MKRLVAFFALLFCSTFVLLPSSSASTVTFTEIILGNQDPFTDQYAAYNLNGIDAYYYIDARDQFDQHGVANALDTGIIQFLTPVNSLSIDYVLVEGVFANFEIFDAAHHSLGTFMDDASGGDKNASHDFGGVGIAELDFTGSPQYIGISTLTWIDTPEPSSIFLLGTGLAGVVPFVRRKLLK
jgi:hypothetical protein